MSNDNEDLKKRGREAKHDYFDGYAIACIADDLVDALEDAEKELAEMRPPVRNKTALDDETRYTMREAGLQIADLLESQGIYSGAGYLRDNLRGNE